MSSVPFLGLTTNFGCSCHVLRSCCTDCKEKGVCLPLRGVPTLFLRRRRLLRRPFVWFGGGIQPKLFFFSSGMIIIGLGCCSIKKWWDISTNSEKMMGHFNKFWKIHENPQSNPQTMWMVNHQIRPIMPPTIGVGFFFDFWWSSLKQYGEWCNQLYKSAWSWANGQ